MLTIFTTCKSFADTHIALIQRNAIQSWKAIRPRCEVILLGKDKGVASIARDLEVNHIPDVALSSEGLPLIPSLFSHARKVAKFDTLCYVNADVILMDSFIKAVERVRTQLPVKTFLAVGRRRDVDIEKPLSFSGNWQASLAQLAATQGTLHGYSGIDYFVFPKALFTHIPPLVVGRGGWDNWMVAHARFNGIPVVDMTGDALVVHQGHDLPNTREEAARFKDQGQRNNVTHAGGFANILTIRDADWILKGGKLEKKPLARLSLFYPWRLLIALKRWVRQRTIW